MEKIITFMIYFTNALYRLIICFSKFGFFLKMYKFKENLTRLYVNIARDCESFKAIKGNTQLYQAIITSKIKAIHSKIEISSLFHNKIGSNAEMSDY